jgi:hypothetical protein
MDLTTAQLCSALAELAYKDNIADTTEKFNKLGFQHIQFFDHAASQAYAVHNEKEIYIIYRGTEMTELKDSLRNGMFWPTDGQKQGNVHAGFAAATDQIWPDIQKHIRHEILLYSMQNNVTFTGHSLGGAMAIISAARSDYISQVYTFGSPRTGNAEYCKNIKSRVYRITNRHDIIPLILPPFGYKHGGIEYRLWHGKIIEILTYKDSWKIQLQVGWAQCKKFCWIRSLLGDHSSTLYKERLAEFEPDNFKSSKF